MSERRGRGERFARLPDKLSKHLQPTAVTFWHITYTQRVPLNNKQLVTRRQQNKCKYHKEADSRHPPPPHTHTHSIFAWCVYAAYKKLFCILTQKTYVAKHTTQLNPKYMCKHNAKIIVNLANLLRFMHGHVSVNCFGD